MSVWRFNKGKGVSFTVLRPSEIEAKNRYRKKLHRALRLAEWLGLIAIALCVNRDLSKYCFRQG